jgi:hypothetical protein
LSQLRGVLDSSHFAQIPATNSAPGMADGFIYRIGYGGHAVMAEDGNIPAALQPVINALETIASRA